MSVEEIKTLLKTDEVAEAAVAAQKLLVAEPDNVQALMLYGACRQLQGDEATFRRIHDELAPKMKNITEADSLEMWRKYDGRFSMISEPSARIGNEVIVGCETRRVVSEMELYGCRPYQPLTIGGRRISTFQLVILCCVLAALIWFAWILGKVL